jgi:hypothetical protein
MAEAMVGDVAVNPAVDVHWGVHWGVHLAVHLAAANRGIGMGRERAAVDRRAGPKCAPAAAKFAAAVTTSAAGAMPAASTTAPRR